VGHEVDLLPPLFLSLQLVLLRISRDGSSTPLKLQNSSLDFLTEKLFTHGGLTCLGFVLKAFHLYLGLNQPTLNLFSAFKKKVYPNLVRVFYSNLSYNSETCTISSEVKKTKIHIPPSLWTSLTGLQFDGAQITGLTAMGQWAAEYNPIQAIRAMCHVRSSFHTSKMGDYLPTSTLTMDSRIVHLIIARILLGRVGNFTKVLHDDCLLL
jgi:hypothetical protein